MLVGKVTAAEDQVDVTRKLLIFAGQWKMSEADKVRGRAGGVGWCGAHAARRLSAPPPSSRARQVSSAFRYSFSVNFNAYPMPVHAAGAAPLHPHLPSLPSHLPFSAPVTGFFMLKHGLPDPITGLWPEMTIREGASAASGGKPQGGVVKLTIGGPPPPGAPRTADAPVEELLGASGGGINAYGKFSWTGVYRPATGELWAYKVYAPKAAPKPHAPRPKAPAGGAAAPAAPPVEARKTRLKTAEDAPAAEESAASRAAANSERANPEFKVPVSTEVRLLMEPYLAVRNHRYRPVLFIDPQDAEKEPTYYDVIKSPMCLAEVERKLVEVGGGAGDGCVGFGPLECARAYAPPPPSAGRVSLGRGL